MKLLMEKADQGTGGAVVNVIAYQGDYVMAGEELKVIDATARAKNCDAPRRPGASQWVTAKLPMSDRHLTRIGRLTALCLLVAAVVMIGLAISGALKEARSTVHQLASHK